MESEKVVYNRYQKAIHLMSILIPMIGLRQALSQIHEYCDVASFLEYIKKNPGCTQVCLLLPNNEHQTSQKIKPERD